MLNKSGGHDNYPDTGGVIPRVCRASKSSG
jgi:hypothetical protein